MDAHRFTNPRSHGPHQIKVTVQPSLPHADNDRSSVELRALDCNLSSLCDHIQTEGFTTGSFSDIVVHALGSTYHLHRLILSRSSYFRNMLHGPWKEASSPVVTLHVDDRNVNGEAISVALAYLYGHHPKLNENNAFRVLAAASFLDLQDLCAICTDFIISELGTSNFLAYQVSAENQDYGIHGERVRNACWGYLCQSGAMELKEVLPKLSSQTLHALLTSDELWVPDEEKRFELALYAFLVKCTLLKTEHSQQRTAGTEETGFHSDSPDPKGKNLMDGCSIRSLNNEMAQLNIKQEQQSHESGHNQLVDCLVDFHRTVSGSDKQLQQAAAHSQPNPEAIHNIDKTLLLSNSFSSGDEIRTTCSYVAMPFGIRPNGMAVEGPSEDPCYHISNDSWAPGEGSGQCSSVDSSGFMNDLGRCGMSPFSWGGRVVGTSQIQGNAKRSSGVSQEEYDAFVNIFDGGSLLYSNMSFEALLYARKQLEELGFPGKAVNDGLWLQMLLSQRVQEIAADTCKNCCLTSMACTCRQTFGFSHGASFTTYCPQDNNQTGHIGNVYVAVSSHGDSNGLYRPVRVHVRGNMDGLAGIGTGPMFVPASARPPTRFVYSRVPINRNSQQNLANDDSDARMNHNGELSREGLTALVGLSQNEITASNVHQGEQTERGHETESRTRLSVANSSSSEVAVQMLESSARQGGGEWDSMNNSSISLDMRTPLSHFPPFRFGVEFEDVYRLNDGQVKYSLEFFYAGSLWKVSVQAFNDEDPQGRRTLGLFLHRRKAEISDSIRKVHVYVDTREKVTARYQLICPSKREVMVFGGFKQRGTLLPKAPKGWGWRTALLFDELSDILQNGSLRIIAVVQLV